MFTFTVFKYKTPPEIVVFPVIGVVKYIVFAFVDTFDPFVFALTEIKLEVAY